MKQDEFEPIMSWFWICPECKSYDYTDEDSINPEKWDSITCGECGHVEPLEKD